MDWSVINREMKLLCKILYWPKKKRLLDKKKWIIGPKKQRKIIRQKTPFIDFCLTTIR